jgi:hypothetical protein
VGIALHANLRTGVTRVQPPNTTIDLGDELLTNILEVVKSSELPPDRKLNALLRAGEIGKLMGTFTDGCCAIALTPSATPSQVKI